ncbi:hypothetical protein MPH_02853 [Macrophomina phaseolina MS6]|uniref:Uncharacterized protein n=1 Tax=Macrophomina phaseolina (strain MS6) TaxID=1126212 RepID=K2RBF7_MACPH|nr:hypothetical protein MPH_02853 [Macrophomina phaseolina MS6]
MPIKGFAALRTRMSMSLPELRLSRTAAKTFSTLSSFPMSRLCVRISADDISARSLSALAWRTSSRRPVRTRVEAPARAKARAMAYPMPVPPPVINTVLSAAELAGLRGDIAGYCIASCVRESPLRQGVVGYDLCFVGRLDHILDKQIIHLARNGQVDSDSTVK